MKEGSKAKIAPMGTRGKKRPTVGNSRSQPSLSFNLNSNILRTRSTGPRQDGEVWVRGDKAQSIVKERLWAPKQVRMAQSSLMPSPQVEVDLGWKR